MKKTFLQHLLRAALISLAIALVFAMIANFTITGSYAEIVNFVLSVGIFFAGILFYFLFKYFKSRQQLRAFLIGTAVLIVATLIYNSNLDLLLINVTNSTKLPAKYRRYQKITPKDPVSFGNYEMKFAFESYEPILHFISAKNELIVITSKIPTDRDSLEVAEDQHGGGNIVYQDFTFHKLNADAVVIDQYVFKRSYENFNELLFGDFIINTDKDYYTTWVTTGDKTEHPFIKQNEDLKISAADQLELVKKIYTEATYYKLKEADYTAEGGKYKKHIYYLMNGSWYKLSTNIAYPENYNPYDQKGETTNSANLFGKYQSNEWGEEPDYSPFKPVYFQRVKIVDDSDEFINFRTDSRQIEWQGNLYCNLAVDKDTLRFVKPLVFAKYFETNNLFESKGTQIQKYKSDIEEHFKPYFYYTGDRIPFKLFTLEPKELYIIKKIK